MMNLSNWKNAMQERPLIGCFVTLPSPALCEYTAMMGFDFTLVDNEHGQMNEETRENMIRASQAAGVPVVIRTATNAYQHVQKALDMGANGVQVTLVNTKEEAERCVRLANFPPEGARGTAYLTRAAAYGLIGDKLQYQKDANATKLLVAQIETVEAVKNLDEILRVEGIDVFFIGPADLASSMRAVPGSEEVMEVFYDCIRRIVAHGRIAGALCGSVEIAKRCIDLGAHYIVGTVNGFMAAGAKSYLEGIKK